MGWGASSAPDHLARDGQGWPTSLGSWWPPLSRGPHEGPPKTPLQTGTAVGSSAHSAGCEACVARSAHASLNGLCARPSRSLRCGPARGRPGQRGTRKRGATSTRLLQSRRLLLAQISASLPAPWGRFPWPSSRQRGPRVALKRPGFVCLSAPESPLGPASGSEPTACLAAGAQAPGSAGPVPATRCWTPSARNRARIPREAFAELVSEPGCTAGEWTWAREGFGSWPGDVGDERRDVRPLVRASSRTPAQELSHPDDDFFLPTVQFSM